MPNIVTVTNIDQSKSGKTRVFFDGRNDWQAAVYLGQKCNGCPPKGARIEADTSSKTFEDGKTVWFLNRWKAIPASQQPILAPQMANQKPPAGWDIQSGDLSRFASNVVGQAITAGLITTPSQVAPWTAAAYRAAEDLRSGRVKDFSDEVKSFVTEPDTAAQQNEDDSHAGDDYDNGAGF